MGRFDKVLSQARQSGARVYSAAYIMPNAPRQDPAANKHRTHLDLLATALREDVPEKLLAAQSMGRAFEILLTLPSIGPFLAYQYVIDLAYSEHFAFDEDDFVQPGPGALNHLAKCFSSLGDFSPSETIAWVTQRQELEFERRALFRRLWGRRLHLIDCQNLFCEVDKYARVAHPELNVANGRSRIKQKFAALGARHRPHGFRQSGTLLFRLESLARRPAGCWTSRCAERPPSRNRSSSSYLGARVAEGAST